MFLNHLVQNLIHFQKNTFPQYHLFFCRQLFLRSLHCHLPSCIGICKHGVISAAQKEVQLGGPKNAGETAPTSTLYNARAHCSSALTHWPTPVHIARAPEPNDPVTLQSKHAHALISPSPVPIASKSISFVPSLFLLNRAASVPIDQNIVSFPPNYDLLNLVSVSLCTCPVTNFGINTLSLAINLQHYSVKIIYEINNNSFISRVKNNWRSSAGNSWYNSWKRDWIKVAATDRATAPTKTPRKKLRCTMMYE